MMSHTTRRAMAAVWLILGLAPGLTSFPGASIGATRGGGPLLSLLRCTTVSLPAQPARPGHRLIRQLDPERFFAPTRQAMFFSHPGDRCAWHGLSPRKS